MATAKAKATTIQTTSALASRALASWSSITFGSRT